MDVTGAIPLLFAPFIGSFMGVLVRRLPAGQPIGFTRSACEGCGQTILARDLVPLLSHMRLRGRCRACGGPIAGFHWRIEAAAAGVAAWALLADPGRVWVDCLLGWTLLTLAWIDWDSLRLPDVLTLPLLAAGLVLTAWQEPDAAADHTLAALLGYALFRAVSLVYRRLRGREGLGEGDAKVLAALGAWLGLDGLSFVMPGAALAGLGLALLMRGRGHEVSGQTAIPFGTCLALAGWIVRLYG